MIHLSEVLDLPVYDAQGVRLGRLEDLRVDGLLNRVDRLLVKSAKTVAALPWSAIEAFSPGHRRITVIAQAEVAADGDNDSILLKRDVLDRQIIDIQGRKVVRVNDLMLETVGPDLILKRMRRSPRPGPTR